jgi:hypothetical protein
LTFLLKEIIYVRTKVKVRSQKKNIYIFLCRFCLLCKKKKVLYRINELIFFSSEMELRDQHIQQNEQQQRRILELTKKVFDFRIVIF